MNAILRQHARSLHLLRPISTSPSIPSESFSLISCHTFTNFNLLARNCSTSHLTLSSSLFGFDFINNYCNRDCSFYSSRASLRPGDNGNAFNFLSSIKSCIGSSKGFYPNFNSSGLHYVSSLAIIKLRSLNFLRSSVCYSTRPLQIDVEEKDGAAAVAARGWQITEEGVGDWRGHAAAVARSLQLIKARMRETTKALERLRKTAKETELAALLSGEYDAYSCFLEVQAGAGGTESMDWAAMVLRMYKMWAQRRNFEVTVIEEMPGEEAGIKRATLQLDGQFAYGYTKSEVGVHRLVRISPFDSGKRRHTSFSAVAVIPVLDKSLTEVQINDADIRIERYRAGGPGGQHANKTESAVRIIHIPTGLTASSQSQRSQHQNRQIAMDVLQARLHQMEKKRQAQAAAQHTQSLNEISWGNQIRSYVLQPYQVVKDLRTGFEATDPASVLDGDLDGFILEFLASTSSNKAE